MTLSDVKATIASFVASGPTGVLDYVFFVFFAMVNFYPVLRKSKGFFGNQSKSTKMEQHVFFLFDFFCCLFV